MRPARYREFGRPARAAAVVILGVFTLLIVVWALPRASAAADRWLRSPTVEMDTLSVPQGLPVAAQLAPGQGVADNGGSTVALDAGLRFTMVGVVCAVPAADGPVTVRLRASADGRTWGEWHEAPLERGGEDGESARAFTEPVWTGGGRYLQVAAQGDGTHAPARLEGVRVVAIDSLGGGDVGAALVGSVRRVAAAIAGISLTATAAADTPAPAIVTRRSWGADESLRRGSPSYATVKMAFIHHTAGGSTYSRAEAPAVVRGIYAYHTKSLGWSDIGYNFLVDRFGTVYEGRHGGVTKGVVGAQVYGFNTGSTGISVMGTYTKTGPPAAAVTALTRLLAWKLALHRLDPSGTAAMTCGASDKYKKGATVTFPVIAGHRQANYTECPGDAFYALLPKVRTAVGGLAATGPWVVTLGLSASHVAVNDTVRFGGSVHSSVGNPAAGVVTVQKRQASGGSWIDWRTARLDAAGDFSISVTMTNRQAWEFRAAMPDSPFGLAAYSAVTGLTVGSPAALKVTLELSSSHVAVNDTVTYSGSVRTASGKPVSGVVIIQKRWASGGQWSDWRTAPLDAAGDYSTLVAMTNLQTWRFRAMMPGHDFDLTGYSALQALEVSARAPASVAPTEETLFTFGGRGWGHGIGMSQYGAYGYAKHGWTYKAILRHYYTGVSFGVRSDRYVRVLLADGQSDVRLTSSRGFKVTSGSARHSVAAGVTARVSWSGGAYRVTAGAATWTFASPITFTPGSQPLRLFNANQNGWTNGGAGARYRGTLRVVRSNSAFLVVNRLLLETYLRGVVPCEVPASWSAEALKAQAVAARSYALRGIRDHGEFDLYCTAASQVYNGYDAEAASTTAAVKATAGVVPLHGGAPIVAYYSSTSGGHTENIENVWGGSPVGYLKGVTDAYDTLSPYHIWPQTLRFSESSVSAKLGTLVRGDVRTLYVTKRGASPRVVRAYVVGSGGDTAVSGWELRGRLGLRDSWFSVRSMSVSPAAADAARIEYGQRITLEGRSYPAIASGKRVTLRYYRDSVWHSTPVSFGRTVRQSFTMGGGADAGRYTSYSFSAKPSRTTTYYFLYGKSRSPKTTIKVRPVVTLVAPAATVPVGGPVAFTGTVRPLSRAGSTVTLQRFDGDAWVEVADGTVKAGGSFDVSWRPAAGQYALRARVPAGDQMLAAVSPELQLTAE